LVKVEDDFQLPAALKSTLMTLGAIDSAAWLLNFQYTYTYTYIHTNIDKGTHT